MSSRTSLPSTLTTGATLTPSGEGVTFNPFPAAANQIPVQQVKEAPAVPVKSAVNNYSQGVQQTEKPPVVLPSLSPSGAANSSNQSGGRPNSDGVTTTHMAEKKEWGIKFNPLNIVWLVLIFIIVIMVLYSSKPNMVTNLENGQRVISNNKLVFWTVLITIIIAVMAFAIMSVISKRFTA